MPDLSFLGLPPDALDIALVLALALFIGFEREEHKQTHAHYSFGGIRTFPLIALSSFALARLAADTPLLWGVGLGVVGALLLVSFRHKLDVSPSSGMTTEVSAITTYVIGGLVAHQDHWIALTIAVLGVLLLELKRGLEGLTEYVAPEELAAAAKFLVLAAVIWPIVPDRDYTRFAINPWETWLVVVAVSAVSFGSYGLQRFARGRGGVLLSALLGGVYSSTVTTIVLSRQAAQVGAPNRYAGGILAASGMMYARLALLIAFFNLALARVVAPGFVALSLLGVTVGWLVARMPDGAEAGEAQVDASRNPLELRAAFTFAAVFLVTLVLTALAREHLGSAGLYTLAAVLGLADVDPFILGLTEASGTSVPLAAAAVAITIAAASNNLAKAGYAVAFADRATGKRAAGLLVGLGAAGLAPLIWL